MQNENKNYTVCVNLVPRFFEKRRGLHATAPANADTPTNAVTPTDAVAPANAVAPTDAVAPTVTPTDAVTPTNDVADATNDQHDQHVEQAYLIRRLQKKISMQTTQLAKQKTYAIGAKRTIRKLERKCNDQQRELDMHKHLATIEKLGKKRRFFSVPSRLNAALTRTASNVSALSLGAVLHTDAIRGETYFSKTLVASFLFSGKTKTKSKSKSKIKN